MLKRIKSWFTKPKAFLVENTYRIVPAFELNGTVYYMHEDPVNTATGRGLSAMVYLDEITMRCSSNYLMLHCEAVDKILSDPRKIDIMKLAQLHNNLKERARLSSVIPDQVYRLASVVFFTKEESPFKYDPKTADKKIAAWKEAQDMHDFFLQTPLAVLLPFLTLPESNSPEYLMVAEKLNRAHLSTIRGILSRNVSEEDI